ncbi:MAG: T9SS type A sorting domain-containing protein [Saprospiraceae bacterium]|nr:T9SS type A sorting domain-containing protein [Saprospiraceae bacterium]
MKRLLNNHLSILSVLLICSLISHLTEAQYPFRNIASTAGISDTKGAYGLYVNDFNNDHLEDILITFTNKSPVLYQNLNGHSFIDVSQQARLSYEGKARTAIWVDVNNDGWADVYVAGKEDPDMLLINREGQFEDVTEEYGIFKVSNTFSVNIAEINQDEYLDIYLSNFLEQNMVLENDGSGLLKDKVNYHQLWDQGYSMASIFFDYDNDGDDDLYLVHDADQPNILYQKQSDGSYLNVSSESGADIAANGMGVDIADVNNDGCLDLYITNLDENKLLLNDCNGRFSDISETAGVNDKGMGWGTTFIDYNNDGWVDILACNDTYFSYYPNQLFMNNGDLTFTSVQMSDDPEKTGSYGCTCTDINLDGKMDLAIANLNEGDPFQLLENISEDRNKWTGFLLEGTSCNVQAIGTRVEVLDKQGVLHTDQVTGGNGYAAQGSSLIHFGLRQSDIDTVLIYWPDGMIQSFTNLEINTYYQIIQGETPIILNPSSSSSHGIKNVNLSVYPNPSTASVVVALPQDLQGHSIDYFLTDIKGKLLLTGTIVHSLQATEIDWSTQLESGLYILTLTNDSFRGVKKITILNE